ncbi:kinase-like domain-containing protein [Mycena vulgaris]|nr:kinase-like domain-containing protein [Mycena vulgaris]
MALLEPQHKISAPPLDRLLESWERRLALLPQVLSEPEPESADDPPQSSLDVRGPIQPLDDQIETLLVHVLDSPDARHSARRLHDQDAQYFLDAVHYVLCRGSLPTAQYAFDARRLMLKLSEASETVPVPSTLHITGVNDRIEHPIFCGGFGDVFRASYRARPVALKRLRVFQEDSTPHRTRLRFCREALVWESLRHPFILPLLGIDSNTFPFTFCLVSPWMNNGTVLVYLKNRGRGEVDRLLLETAEGLKYLHSMNIVHGDLRGNNILISDDFSVCLSDFGLANIICDTQTTPATSTSHAGSARWFAPELIRPTAFNCEHFVRTPASDVYAFGCVCYELYTGTPPFSEVKEHMAAILKVIDGERPAKPPNMSNSLWTLVNAAWSNDWRSRPKTHEIISSLRVSTTVKSDNLTVALGLAQQVENIVQKVPFIALATTLMSELLKAYKEVKDMDEKRDFLLTNITELTRDFCETILRMEATHHVDLIGRLKADIETYTA